MDSKKVHGQRTPFRLPWEAPQAAFPLGATSSCKKPGCPCRVLPLSPASGPGQYKTKSLGDFSAWPDLLRCDTPDGSGSGANEGGQEGRLGVAQGR